MLFRERGSAIQFLRVKDGKEGKRTSYELVGRIPRTATKLPGELAEKLTDTEKQEFTAHLEHLKSLESLRLKVAAFGIVQTATDAGKYYQEASEAEREMLRQLFSDAIGRLRRAPTVSGEDNDDEKEE
jgi:hypothetical protein